MATTSVIFPNTINVVLNDTLSSFISTTTVSPTVAGTFVFNLNNSSGAVLTASSVFDAVGNFTIYSSFTPTDSVTYQASSATVIVTVQDNDAYNNYFNIPVTDLSNILVNGDFNYIPSSIASGTSAICPPNVPGWRFFKYTSYPAVVNNIDLSSNGITSLPYPFGTKCVQFVGGYMSQPVFCIAGSYTLSAYIAAKPVATSAKYLQVWINNVSITTSNAQYPTLNNWQQLSVTFTIAKTGFQNIMIGSVGSNTFYIGNISIKPVVSNLISYLKFSKISSQIFNGTFETEIKTENSKLLTPLANWTIVNNNVWVLNNYSTYTTIPLPYPSGNQCVAFEGLGKITQSFTYTASTLNYLSFYLCIIGDLSMNQIKVSINSTMICDLSNSNASFGQGSGTWQKVLFTNITTVDGTNTLTIEGLDNTNTGQITAIDNVVFGSVNKSVPSITYSTQTNTYGTPLLNNLIATCSVSATITYFLDSAYTNQVYNDSTLPVGTYTIYVIAVPLDTYNYLTSYTSATLNVVTPSLSVVFPNIINVVLNDTLSSFISTTTVSPTVAGTFVFKKNNSSGAVLTASSVFDAVGNFTIYSSFTPTDSVTYAACSASYTVSVQDKDLFNNYFNIPVTDSSNILVNGNFNYIPSSIASGTSSNSLTNVPGWNITYNSLTILYNNVDLSFGLTFPYPFGTKCLRLKSHIFQFFYCVAGTYTLSFYLGVPVTTTGTNYMVVNIDTTRVMNAIANQGWQIKTVNFTIATTGMHFFYSNHSGNSTYYIGNVIITPVNNFTYLKPSKINSLISNGVFETEIKTANSKSLTPITNWTVDNNNVWILNNYSSYAAIPSPYPSGNQCIAIESLGKVSQTFIASASSSNFLSFYACSVSDASTNALRFRINNNIIADVSTNVYRSGTWTKVIYGNITTISGTNTLSIEGITATTNFISAIDNVIFGQVVKDTRLVTFVSPTDYPFLPLRNETITSNAYNAVQHGSLNGRYECTASSNRVFTNSDIFYLFDTNPSTNYSSGYVGDGIYYSWPYANNGFYSGATNASGVLTYFFKTNVVNVGTVSGEWIQVKVPSPIRLTRYGLAPREQNGHRFPLDYYILGSNDGSTWYSIKSVTNSQIPTWPNTQYVDVSNNTQMYMFYRLVCTKVTIYGPNMNMLNFSQFALFGDNSKTEYGSPLGSTLNAITDISGTYTYYIDPSYNNRVYADSTLPVGTYTLYVVFAPSDTVDYITSYANTTLTVVMPPLRVVFPNTINVVLNDTLSSFISGTAVSPTVAGTFVFQKNNSSGAVLTSSSVFDAVGNFTIYSSFTPTDTVTYTFCSATYIVTVEDSDAYNNYFNIPVTDLSNILVNGNFNYIPSTYLSGTATLYPYNVPGWRFSATLYPYVLNNYNLNSGWSTFPPPFGPIYLRLQAASIYQASYYIAGTYTFSMTYCNLYSYPTGYFRFYLDGVQIFNQYLGTLNNWQTLTFNFTVATTGMHYFQIYQSSTTAYFGNLNISPISVSNNVSYMKFSKINSQIFNGSFETEIQTANSKSLTPLANWTIVNNNVWVLNNYLANSTIIVLPYPSGSQCVGIEGLGKISQTFNYIDSSFNYLSFYACSVSDLSTNQLTIRMNGTTIGAANFPSCGQGSWAKFLFTNITTVAGTNTLTIEGLDTTNTGKITAIDNVVFGSVNMAPTTTTYSITTPIKYGSTVSSLFTAACSVPATFTYYLDDAYTNQVFADSTLPVGNYQMYVKSTPIDIYYYLTSFASASFSVVNPNPLLVFPKIINVVYNDTLANFINYTTVTPNIAGTFAFTNSSGSTLTTSSVYNVIGKFTIYCTFIPTDTATYETTSAIYSVTVEDNDAPNNYFNIPVTNTTNLLVNGNFEYVPSTYPPGTVTSNAVALTASNIPGWRFASTNTSSYSTFINDVSPTSAISYPFPFSGNKCAGLRGGQIYQMVFLNAGTYTFSAYIARSVLQLINSYLRVYVDGKIVFLSSILYQSLTNWQYITFTFTVSTTNIHEIFVASAGGPMHYIGNMSIVPTYPNPVYLNFSKIDSQIFNGSFETEIKTANSKAIVPLTNWTTQNNTIWVLNNYSSYGAIPLPYPSGNQCIAIENLGQITQTFNYTASSLNYLSFYICGDASSNPVQFSLNGTTICTLKNCSSAGGTWQKCIYTNLTTISGTNTLTIQGTVNNKLGYIGIDNVILGQVNRAITTVTYPTPSPIVYGTTLVNSLNASCTVPGTFKYYIDISYNTQVFSDTILIPSIYSIYVIYTPTDQVNYAPGFATADLSINKLTPTLTYPALSPIYYGTLLETSLIATANIPCKIDYYLDAARTIGVNGLTVLNIGSYTIYAYLIPTDMVTYSPILTSSTLTVNSAGIITPTMYYPSVTPITYGATLTGKLNASVLPNIPGTINYYTDSNFVNQVKTYTVLTPGIWSIYAVFTPNDLSSCNTTTSSVSLFVSNISTETRSLVLNTSDISASTNADDYFNITISNATGVVENNRYTHTWNTNLRSVLGDDFYNKYTKFSIRLKEFVNGNLFTTIQDASQNLSLYYKSFNECKLSGIQFDPQPYENGISTNTATIQTLTRQFPASSVSSYYNVFDGRGSTYTFSKTTDIVPIKIDMPNLYDDQYFAPSTNAILFGHLTFVFEVHGILS